MKRFLVVLSVLLLVVLGGWYFNRESPVSVPLYTVSTGVVEQIAANSRAGSVRACHRSRLALPKGGRVEHLLVAEGDRVKQGQLLLQLYAREQQVGLQQAEVDLRLAELERQQRCHTAELAKRELARARGLAAKKLISGEQLDKLSTDAQIQSLACELAAVELEKAAVSKARAEVLLDDMQLRAPYAGIVAEINGEPGEFTTPSPPGVATPPAVDLIDDSCLYVRAPIDEVEAASLQVDQPARITLDAYRGESFEGRLSRIAPYVSELEKQARTVDVDVLFNAREGQRPLLVGYSADVEIILSQRDAVLRVPTDTLLEGDRVLRFNAAQGLLETVNVETGLRNWSWVEIRSGLSAGDRILSRLDTEGAVDGARVIAE
ncbi:efflux RND transporter periplasmic adaptor subunit [Neptuniibacter sp. CAU 1671]|uniref:efflux RND transporter periplasmic adaptor subunit n=1 Tax=Neptuniibacter sp. CAU 1671 TaxID=3032593 RepID=UPI0023DC56A0|nr:efflux RND transporter periplasmic adaptor subunit [Neptuniibacter sp. CAU 1671]MDF2181698.1 efflux RND transporter periplasmic adaptor subunit [Neptuniibacter sp. CAU 1671]